MRILVVGKGGREHAILEAIARSPGAHRLYAFPGSDAILEGAHPVAAHDLLSLGAFLRSERIDLCVAGEESYLVKDEGLAAVCAEAGVPCWGPPRQSAQLEASKVFAKEFMVRHGIPTAGYAVVDSAEEARAVIQSYPVVLKFDGLAAGKGVAVCASEAEAESFLDTLFVERRFGEGRLLVEECLEGPELSIFVAVCDGAWQVVAAARDYKRLGEGDAGPNTGGMGSVACRDRLVDAALMARIEAEVVAPTVRGLMADGLPYRGFLYFGLMLTADGPRMLEYNCRFGDPEAQAVMPLVSGDFARYLADGARGELRPERIAFSSEWSVCVILASAGYPESSRNGDRISGLESVCGAQIYHAGTEKAEDGGYVTNGGRVLAVVAQGASLEEAVNRVYRESAKVDFPGAQRRLDIGRLHFG